MAILSPIKKLFIPNKNMPAFNPNRYGTDMRAIEAYINNLATGGISEITSVDGSVTITDATGPTVDLSVVPGSELFSFGWGGIGNYPNLGRAGIPLCNVWVPSSGDSSQTFAFGPFKAESGGQVLEQVNQNCFTGLSVGGVTLQFGLITVSDAAGTNSITISNSGTALSLFGGSVVGWTVDGTTVGTQLALGSPQTSHLITSTSTTTFYWIFGEFQMAASGLG